MTARQQLVHLTPGPGRGARLRESTVAFFTRSNLPKHHPPSILPHSPYCYYRYYDCGPARASLCTYFGPLPGGHGLQTMLTAFGASSGLEKVGFFLTQPPSFLLRFPF